MGPTRHTGCADRSRRFDLYGTLPSAAGFAPDFLAAGPRFTIICGVQNFGSTAAKSFDTLLMLGLKRYTLLSMLIKTSPVLFMRLFIFSSPIACMKAP